ncbi:MAG: 2-hydroxyglutaryl-CoA dehydratase [Candidatus Wallbacteria bacterium HGW-Wallbacteria-1]|uniref:2-hydroxyglutaryl-CoA dehydratase n=1 Tax=Candidatus Wallbacteria bacterium HGW-Wallbacteria-1 TaxID=2013854 RepID=A0A2N1PV51_9BACT|nr:MAG: 2-hydroxyglutaryl-CoA dehydratase [Candidatus Wallbacteria bacterium HGW-Wallbacteria-1]
MKKVGFTTTIPVEIPLAAGWIPVDLNNRFITSDDPLFHIRRAERDGLPRNCCAWIKGIYGVVMESPDLDAVVMVTQGDCSNTHALSSLLRHRCPELRQILFGYPYPRNPEELDRAMDDLCQSFGTTLGEAEKTMRDLEPLRHKLRIIDDLTWREGTVTGEENHLALVSATDFNSDPTKFESFLDEILARASSRDIFAADSVVRLGIAGVPPLFTDFYQKIDSLGGRVVYNELSRQFAMIGGQDNLVERYFAYTYPYSFHGRVRDIRAEAGRRKLHGVISYVQSFCFRQLEQTILKDLVGLPVLTVEASDPGPVDSRTVMRLEAFIDMIQESR